MTLDNWINSMQLSKANDVNNGNNTLIRVTKIDQMSITVVYRIEKNAYTMGIRDCSTAFLELYKLFKDGTTKEHNIYTDPLAFLTVLAFFSRGIPAIEQGKNKVFDRMRIRSLMINIYLHISR